MTTQLALEELYDAHHRMAVGLAYNILRNQQDAEEAVQEAFLSVWRKRSTFDPARGSSRVWVLTAVRNRALDILRARKRRPMAESLRLQDHESPFDVAVTAVASADREWVLRALATLPAAQQGALELAYFGGLSHAEIARLMDVPVGTVKGRIRLALEHLRLPLAAEIHALAV